MNKKVFLISYLVVSILIIALGSTIAIIACFFDPRYEYFVLAVKEAFLGIAMLLAGFLNIALIRSEGDVVVRGLCVLANVYHAAIFGIYGYYVPFPAPYIWMSMFIVAALFSITMKSRPNIKLD